MPKDQESKKAKGSPLSSVELWGGLSVLISLISLALPWWGIDTTIASFSWGLSSGPAQLAQVIFFTDRLESLFSYYYGFMQFFVVLTVVLAALGSLLKRWPILAAATLSSVLTDLIFMADVGNAVYHECDRINVNGASCISGLVGQGTTGSNHVAWGLKSGFYVFVASGVLILITLALLQWNKSRGRIHPPSANIAFHPTNVWSSFFAWLELPIESRSLLTYWPRK